MTIQQSFQQKFVPIGLVFSEKKNNMWNDDRRRTDANDGNSSHYQLMKFHFSPCYKATMDQISTMLK